VVGSTGFYCTRQYYHPGGSIRDKRETNSSANLRSPMFSIYTFEPYIIMHIKSSIYKERRGSVVKRARKQCMKTKVHYQLVFNVKNRVWGVWIAVESRRYANLINLGLGLAKSQA